ncbi:MAG TPA: M15 family metallopeptidase, partial [Flavisolibacter sp.]|nr:M15 family metallopeptidase [Flavisolibacter sp.]
IGLYSFTSIEYIFKFIMQQLANIAIVPSDLFTSYGNRRNIRYNETERVFPKEIKNSNYKPQYKQDLANGIWQIIKLVIDQSVSERRLADSSFSTAQGSLLNFIRSAAQEPLVEFYMDTYGDMYHLIVRKPPYDQKGIVSLIEGKVNTETGETETPPAIIDIEADDVLDERLRKNDTEVYSWYSFFPKNNLINSAKDFSLAYLGALYFEEYAQVFGSRPFQQCHPYLAYVPKNDREGTSLDVNEKQAIFDLKYVVESTQYLPFARKGTITLNRDRRIKIGNVIRYKPTGEIFFVDAVQHKHIVSDNGIDAVTTINVSRGLVEQFIYGTHLQNENGETRFVSYFNLIDTRLNFEEKTIDVPVTVNKKTGTRTVEAPVKGWQQYTLSLNNPDLANISAIQITQPDMVKGIVYLEKYNSFPQSKALFTKFINAITAKGFKVILLPMATNRSYAEQAALKHNNINNARAGHSKHEKGMAIDITVASEWGGKVYSKQTSESDWRLTGVPAIANQLGLRWGGAANNGTFGSYVDRVHFEVPDLGTVPTEVITEDIIEEVTEIRKQKTLDREGIFKNFRVNKFTFNFFLKDRQFDPDYRKVTSRQIFNSDAQGSLPDVVVTANKKLRK